MAPEIIEGYGSIPLQAKQENSVMPYARGAMDAYVMTKAPVKVAVPWILGSQVYDKLKEKKHGGWLKEFE